MCVVCDDAEPGVCRVLLHDPTQCHLGGRGHGVGLVEDDELEGRLCRVTARSRLLGPARLEGKYLASAAKGLDLLPHHVDSSIVTRVEFEDHLLHVDGAVYLPCQGEDRRRFARSWGSVEEEVREALLEDRRGLAVRKCDIRGRERATYVRVDKLVDRGENVVVAGDVVERVWSVFLYPVRVCFVSTLCFSPQCIVVHPTMETYHGNVSWASIGRLAALRFVLSEAEKSGSVGVSTSILLCSSSSILCVIVAVL